MVTSTAPRPESAMTPLNIWPASPIGRRNHFRPLRRTGRKKWRSSAWMRRSGMPSNTARARFQLSSAGSIRPFVPLRRDSGAAASSAKSSETGARSSLRSRPRAIFSPIGRSRTRAVPLLKCLLYGQAYVHPPVIEVLPKDPHARDARLGRWCQTERTHRHCLSSVALMARTVLRRSYSPPCAAGRRGFMSTWLSDSQNWVPRAVFKIAVACVPSDRGRQPLLCRGRWCLATLPRVVERESDLFDLCTEPEPIAAASQHIRRGKAWVPGEALFPDFVSTRSGWVLPPTEN